eukprot:2369363-Alexandrium_andersonii.AAC.1
MAGGEAHRPWTRQAGAATSSTPHSSAPALAPCGKGALRAICSARCWKDAHREACGRASTGKPREASQA